MDKKSIQEAIALTYVSYGHNLDKDNGRRNEDKW